MREESEPDVGKANVVIESENIKRTKNLIENCMLESE